jgi:hypothetical protein
MILQDPKKESLYLANLFLNRRLPSPLGKNIIDLAQSSIPKRVKELEEKIKKRKEHISWHWHNYHPYTKTPKSPFGDHNFKRCHAVCIFINMGVSNTVATTIVLQFKDDSIQYRLERYAVGIGTIFANEKMIFPI